MENELRKEKRKDDIYKKTVGRRYREEGLNKSPRAKATQ